MIERALRAFVQIAETVDELLVVILVAVIVRDALAAHVDRSANR